MAWVAVLTAAGAGVLGAVAALDDPVNKAQPGLVKTAVAKDVGIGAIRYGRDIRPILSDRCFQCHGPDTAKREAGLRLDERESATAARKDGPAAIVPGKPEASEMWRRVNAEDPKEVMPPAESHKRALSGEEKELVRRWIEQGAPYEAHWSFIAPKRPDVPAVKNETWARGPVDRFVLAAQEAKGWGPSPEAPRETLMRRVFMDLTGLPPTPEELDAFLADTKPDAYERWVDKLLTEEPYKTRYAERMATPWMDQSRYADTCGIHMDAGRQMWLWRDWVIQAYRSNMPFNEFVKEQLAGDLMPGSTEGQKIASGFNRNHVTTDEGGAIAEEYLVEYAVDRTATTASVFLGLTVGCARCHDHKFDPISQEEFYGLYAYFNSIEEPGLYSQTPDSNRAYEPFMLVPTGQQKTRLGEINTELAALKVKLDERRPEEEQERAEFLEKILVRAGVTWPEMKVVAAGSVGGSTTEVRPDGSVVISGKNPDDDEHEITLRTEATGLKLLAVEALPEPTAFEGRPGRAPNGNAVVSGITAEAVSVADPAKREPVKFAWAWADWSQKNGDFDITNVIADAEVRGGDRGWAIDAHGRPGGRLALLVAEKPFGFEGGTEIRVKLEYKSVYKQHTLAHVRVRAGTIGDVGVSLLPAAMSRWYLVGPFPGDKQNNVFEPTYGPEEGEAIDFKRNFGSGNQYWRFDGNLTDGRTVALADGRNVTYVGRYVYSPVAREVPVSLGSDDGFRLYVNGKEVAQNNTERGVMPDQDKAVVPLRAGRNAVVLKIVNTGGAAGYYWKGTETAELAGDLVAALLPSEARAKDQEARLERAWRVAFLPQYKETESKITALNKEVAEINAKVPQTMIMQELAKRRDTFVLMRGQYDKPDMSKPVKRHVPAALGKLPEGAPDDRLGLAQWITSEENPLTSRVTVNRLWELVFGTGLVRTTEDFGLQGEWPSHPELLDWLAVEFRESGWDVNKMVKLLVTSSTYRQSSHIRPELRESDPDNRLLAYYPRHRLTAEQIRDQALYVSGLLVEKAGGPSVKPYQPEGLWQEVAMPQSNTREYKRGEGEDLWRRSLYTYWKRAVPPPSMLAFDAPDREFCTIRRASTSTPLQALTLWNDEQFVEAARVLAQRTLSEDAANDGDRLEKLFRRCTSREPNESEMKVLSDALAAFRERYRAAPADAEGLLKVGMAPRAEGLDKTELAAWTMVASAGLNLYGTTTQQ